MKTIDDLIATLNEHHEFNTVAHTANVLQNQENDRNLETINSTLKDIKTDLNSFFKVQQKQYDEQRVIDLENQREAGRAAGAGALATSAGATDEKHDKLFDGNFGFAAIVTGLTAAVSGYIVGLSQAIASSFAATSKLVTAGFNSLSNIITTRFANIAVSFKSFFEPVARIARALSDVLSKGGTGQFLKGDTYKVFGKFSSIMYNISDVIAKFVKSFGNLGARIGRIASAFSDILSKGGTSQFLKGDTYKVFGKFTETMYKISDGIANFVKSTGNFASRFGTTFKPFVKGFTTIFETMKKFAVPLTVIIASVRAIYETVTEATGFFDGVFSLIKNLFKELVSAFITFPMELIKDIISWIAGALGFDAIESALDSFDIDAIFRDIVDGIYDGIKGVLSWMGSMLNPLNWFGKDTQDDIDSETARLESEVQDARSDAADLSNAYAVSEDGSHLNTVVLSTNSYDQNKELSEQEIVSKGMRVATPEQRQRMQQAADDRVAQAEAALKEHQDVSSVVSAVQPMNIFKHIGNLFGGGEEEQTDTSKYDRAKARADRAFDTSGDPFAPKVSREDRERALSQRNELRDRMDYFTPTIGPLQKGVGDVVSRGQDIFAAAASGAMDFGGRALGTAKDFGGQTGQALDAAGEFGGQAIDAAGEAFDTVSETVGGATADAISAVKDKASQLFDPIKDAFNNMIDTVKGIFDFSKIKMMLTNMFAEIGVPRVEFDVPIIGKIGFGPFYPFAPDAGSFQQNHNRSLETGSEGSTLKTRDSSIAAVGAYADSEAEYGMTYDSSASTTLQETKRDGDLETTRNTNVFAGFDYETGTGKVSLESTDFLDNIATDEYKEIKNAAEEYNVGPIAFGKVRRMIDAGASAQDIRDFLKENEVTVSDKITQFLSPFTDKAKDLAGQATEAATDLAYDAEDAITGAGSAIGDAASTVGFGAMDQVSALSDFAGGAFKKAQAALIGNPFENLDEDTKDEIDAIRASLFSLRGGQDSLGNTDNAQLEGPIEQSAVLQQTIDQYVKDAADLAGMTPEQFLEAEKLLDETGQTAGRALSFNDVEDFDFGDIDNSSVEPIASRSLSAPVGQASQEIAAEQSSATVNAPVTNANVNNSSQVNNVYNTKTISPPPQARSSDPTFQRMQNNNFSGQ